MDDLLDFGTFDPERERRLFGPLSHPGRKPTIPTSDPQNLADKQSTKHAPRGLSPGILIGRRHDVI